MSGADERRRFPRKPFEQAVFCYQDGVRVKARPVDLSIGGIFLEVDESARLPKGTSLGVALERQAGFDPPIYLFGTVVRHQPGPPEGVGLRWDKAVTTGDRQDLARALAHLFGLPERALDEQVEPRTGRMRACFRFEPFLRAMVGRVRDDQAGAPTSRPEAKGERALDLPPPRQDLRDPQAGPIGLSVRVADLDGLDLGVVPHDRGTGSVRRLLPAGPTATPAAGPRRAEELGAITSEIRRDDAYARADLTAVMDVAGTKIDLHVVGLSTRGMLAECTVAPVDKDGSFPVRFALPTRDGSLLIKATCRIRALRSGRDGRAPGMELHFERVDEGTHGGLLTRYVKWLHYSSLANG